MILSDLLQYDLSGEKADFKKENVRFSIYTSGQTIYLNEPAYANSVKIWKVTDYATEAGKTAWSVGNQFQHDGIYDAECRDSEAESYARVLYASWPYRKTEDTTKIASKDYYLWNEYTQQFYKDTNIATGDPLTENHFEKITNSWNAKLINKVHINTTGTTANPLKIIVSYQRFKKSTTDIIGDGEGPLYSPGLMRTVIEKLNSLEMTQFNDIVASNGSSYIKLDIDLTGLKPENFIKNEKHAVDTTSDKFVIRPISGSFYKYTDSNLKLVFESLDGSTNKTLVQETGDGQGDYEVIGVNYAKTSMSEPTGGVYEFIALKKAFVGFIYLDYHAFGGEVSVSDIANIQNDILAIKNQISSDGLLTKNTLKNSLLIINMLDRLDFLEHQLEHYRTQVFLYTTHDYDNWVNVAYINGHPWMDAAPIPDNEVGKFQFEIQHFNAASASSQTQPSTTYPKTRASIDLEFKFSYEAVRNSSNAIVGIRIKTKEVHMTHPTFEEFGTEYFYKRMTPKFRVIGFATKNGEAAFNNGLMVQMAITSLRSDSCMISVSDKTAAKSPWTLVDSVGAERIMSGTVVFNDATWSEETGKTSNVIPVYGNGYAIMRGAVDVKTFNIDYTNPSALNGDETISLPLTNGGSVITMNAAILDSDLLFDNIQGIRIHVLDRCRNSVITSNTDYIDRKTNTDGSTITAISGSIMYYLEDMCGMTVELKKSGSNNIIGLCGYCGTNSVENNRFCLLGIDIF